MLWAIGFSYNIKFHLMSWAYGVVVSTFPFHCSDQGWKKSFWITYTTFLAVILVNCLSHV